MTNYDRMKNLLEEFADKYGQGCRVIESDISDLSEDKLESKSTGARKLVYGSDKQNMQVLDMDEIAHNIYRIARFPESTRESESPASADAFVIDADDTWYFIEFKNQRISKAKESVTKKAYQNWHWLVDILYEMKDSLPYDTFDYENPIAFAKENVVYILVVSEDKNYPDVEKMHKCILAGEKFRPEYMEKLEKYIFKDAYVYTPEILEREFVKKFVY